MSSIKIDHVAIAVTDMEAALKFWQDGLGLDFHGVEAVPAEAVEIAFLETANAHIELVRPTTDDSGIARYIDKKGMGIHHLCLAVDDIEAALRHLANSGFELINDTPRTRDNGTRYAFVHPRSTGGVLLELYEAADK
jgi:methylmalonyl-CoA/ethylmalonyl-CoA epimerase